MRNVDAAQHGGAGVSAAQPEVGFYLDVLGEGTLHLDIRRCRDLDIVSKAAEQAGTRRRRAHRLGRLRQQRAEIRLWIKAGTQHGDGAGENAAGGGAAETQVRVGHRADAFRIAHAHLVRGGVEAKHGGPIAAVSGETAELDFAAAGFAGEALDGSAVAVEQQDAVRVRDAVGDVADVERRTGEFHAAGDLWRGQSPAHAGVRFQHAGGGEAAKTASSAAIARPAGVVRSRASFRETKSTPRWSSSWSVASKSATDRPQRSNRHPSTTSISRRRAAKSMWCWCGGWIVGAD